MSEHGPGFNKRLRILMVAPQPFFRARGTPFSVLHRIRALCSAGHHVDLVTYPFGEDISFDGLTIHRAGKPPMISDVKIGPSFAKIMLDWPVYLLTKRLLRTNNYDILHSHEEAAFFCVRLASKHGLMHIYDMHSSLPLQLKTFGSFDIAPVRGTFEYLEHKVLKTCDGVITICEDLADTALAICGDTPHAMIENTADDREAFGDGREDVREQLGLHGKHIILYTGTFESYQGLDILMAAMKQLIANQPQSHLLMVGGQSHQIQSYKTLAKRLGIFEHITFTGMISPSRIPSFQDASDMIVSPRSSGTNSPLKIYGYMRCGRPIVATNLFTHTQVLNDSVALLVDPTPDAFARGMEQLISDNELASRLGRAAAQRAEADFSDQAYIAKVLQFYKQVVENHVRPALGAVTKNVGVDAE